MKTGRGRGRGRGRGHSRGRARSRGRGRDHSITNKHVATQNTQSSAEKTVKKAATSQNAADSQPQNDDRLRILCLHGNQQNAEIFESRLSRITHKTRHIAQ